jgi:hypothetical protein
MNVKPYGERPRSVCYDSRRRVVETALGPVVQPKRTVNDKRERALSTRTKLPRV